MKAVVQRVLQASVVVDQQVVGTITEGVLIYLCVMKGDNEAQASYLADKIAGFRMFSDSNHRMNLSLLDIGGEALVISQFTLAADGKKGKRPGFDKAAAPDHSLPIYERFIQLLQRKGIKTQSGVFGAYMQVYSLNNGPVTFVLEK